MAEAHRDREAHGRVDLVHVAEDLQRALERVEEEPRQRAPLPPAVGDRQRCEPDDGTGHHRCAHDVGEVQEAQEADGGHHRGDEHQQRVEHQRVRGRPPALSAGRDVGHPVRVTTQRLGPADRAGGVAGALDVLVERRAVAPEREQREQPPGAGQRDQAGPPPEEGARDQATPGHPAGEEERHRKGPDHLDRVDASHADHGSGAEHRRADVPDPAARSQQDRQHDPRQDRTGEALRADHTDGPEHAGTHREDESGEGRGVGRQAQHPGAAPRTLEGHDQHERGPEALPDPRWQPRPLHQHEEGTLGEEVAVGLVEQLAEVGGVVPQGEGAREERRRALGELDAGVQRRTPELLDHREEQDQRVDRPVRDPGAGRDVLLDHRRHSPPLPSQTKPGGC